MRRRASTNTGQSAVGLGGGQGGMMKHVLMSMMAMARRRREMKAQKAQVAQASAQPTRQPLCTDRCAAHPNFKMKKLIDVKIGGIDFSFSVKMNGKNKYAH